MLSFENDLKGVSDIVNKMQRLAYKEKMDNLNIFFYDVQLFVNIPGFSYSWLKIIYYKKWKFIYF